MDGIFINYRREDSIAYAGRIYDRVSAYFGRDRVFMDIDTIAPGDDFVEAIDRTCASCAVILVLIGKSWASVTDRAGRRRLDNSGDFVRLEIGKALARGIRVIPVLLEDAEMPDPDSLPDDLRKLAFRNALPLSSLRFHQDVDRLIDAVEKTIGGGEEAQPPRRPERAISQRPKPSGASAELVKSGGTAKWGAIVTAYYMFALALLVFPAVMAVTASKGIFDYIIMIYGAWGFWVVIGLFGAAEALLLFLSVDTRFKKLRPRAHIVTSCVLAGLMFALLVAGAVSSSLIAFRWKSSLLASPLALMGAMWAAWAVAFYFYVRNSENPASRIVSALLKGSALELLIAVPCHVLVRRRNECSAPEVTGLGIATGLSLMLMSFGPGVLLLFKKRLDSYSRAKAKSAPSGR